MPVVMWPLRRQLIHQHLQKATPGKMPHQSPRLTTFAIAQDGLKINSEFISQVSQLLGIECFRDALYNPLFRPLVARRWFGAFWFSVGW